MIINKVLPEKYDDISRIITKGFALKDIKVLGTIPFVQMLSHPIVETIFEKIDGELLSSRVGYSNRIKKFIIGDTVPHELLTSLTPNSLLIVPANRESLIMTALCGSLLESDINYHVSGIVLTGGTMPHESVLTLIKRTHIPLILVKEDSFTIAKKLNSMLLKIGVNETDKILKIQEVCEKHVDMDYICNNYRAHDEIKGYLFTIRRRPQTN